MQHKLVYLAQPHAEGLCLSKSSMHETPSKMTECTAAHWKRPVWPSFELQADCIQYLQRNGLRTTSTLSAEHEKFSSNWLQTLNQYRQIKTPTESFMLQRRAC